MIVWAEAKMLRGQKLKLTNDVRKKGALATMKFDRVEAYLRKLVNFK